MDSFSTIFFFAKGHDIAVEAPVNEETTGGAGNGYCVVSREIVVDIPVNEETTGGAGNGYCIVA